MVEKTAFISKRLVYVFIFILCSKLYPQIQFDHITVNDGLSENNVQCVWQDREGYMWFGTMDGLNKYDGYDIQIFRNNPQDSNSISHNRIFALYDDEQYVYAGTDGLLNKWDKRAQKFSTLDIPVVTAIVEDNNGKIWFGTDGFGLFTLDKHSGEIQNFTYDESNPNSISDNSMLDLYIARDGALWIATSFNGVCKMILNDDQAKFIRYRHDPDDPTSIGSNSVITICQDSTFTIWFGTYDGGLNRLTRENAFERFKHDPDDPNSIPDNRIPTVYYDHPSRSLWVGTYRKGLYQIELHGEEVKKIKKFTHLVDDPQSISENSISTIISDDLGIMWIGTLGGGANLFTPQSIVFKSCEHKTNDPFILNDNKIWSFFENNNGDLWVGTTKGVSFLDRSVPGKNRFVNYDFTSRIHHKDGFQIRAIHEDIPGRLWLAIIGAGLGRFNYQKDELTIYPWQPPVPVVNFPNFYTMYDDTEGNLWLGGNGTGLAKFDKTTEKFSYYSVNREPRKLNESYGWVFSMYQDQSGIFWLGTWGHGLVRLNPETDSLIYHMTQDTLSGSSISHDVVLCVHSCGDSILWLGTYGGGLNHYHIGTGRFSHFTTKDGLPNNVIYGIVDDHHGNLWLSTNQGISCFNPATGQFNNFDISDGLQSNEFNLGAYLKTKDGKIFFGSSRGFNYFYPDQFINPYPPMVKLTGFKINGKEVKTSTPLMFQEELQIAHSDKFITFQFRALHYKRSLKNQHAYFLEGFDEDWIYCAEHNEAVYSSLNPGTYRFRVKVANADGLWNELGASIMLLVHPPFWRTWWFYSLVFMVGSVIITLLYKGRVQYLLNIEQVKTAEREKLCKKMAADFHDELGHRVSKIAFLSKMLSGELRVKTAQASKYLQQIEDNSDMLFKEMKEFVWELDASKNTLYDLLSQIKNFSEQLFEETDIAFEISGLTQDLEQITLPIGWRIHLLRIFKEGLTNILKHAADCRNVTLALSKRDDSFEMVLSDDGPGFDGMYNGHGNGLTNMKKRAAELNATLEISTLLNKGTSVRFFAKLP